MPKKGMEKLFMLFLYISSLINDLTSFWYYLSNHKNRCFRMITQNIILFNEIKYSFNKFLSLFESLQIEIAHEVSLNCCQSHLTMRKNPFQKNLKHFSNNVISNFPFSREIGETHIFFNLWRLWSEFYKFWNNINNILLIHLLKKC